MQKCDGVRPVCSRCQRLGKPCAFDSVALKLQLDLMEQRVLELEEEAEGLALRSTLFNHELVHRLTHDDPQTVTQAATRNFLPVYCDTPTTSPSVPNTSGTVTSFQIQGHGTVVARTTIEARLRCVASTGEVPPDLRDLLSVSHSSVQSWIYDVDLNLVTQHSHPAAI